MSDDLTPVAALSIVVVSFNAPALLERCLAALEPQLIDCELIVVRDRIKELPAAWEARLKQEPYQWVSAPAGSTVPDMRLMGIEKASGAVVAFLEDDCEVVEGWCAGLIDVHRREDCAAVGGPVMPGDTEKPLDWAVFFCEYAHYLPPFSGDVERLPGNNVSYKRQVLDQLLESGSLKDGFYESFVNAQLRKQSQRLVAGEKLAVRNINSWGSANLLWVPFNHGRAYAGMRFNSLSKRALYIVGVVFLPALQTVRVFNSVLSRIGSLGTLLSALPFIVLFWTSWSIGEFVGYWLGPGRSREQWR